MDDGGYWSLARHPAWVWNSSQLMPVPYFGAPLPSLAPSSTGDGFAGLQCSALISDLGSGGRFHVAHPFAGAPHMFLGQPVVVEEHAFERRVDAAPPTGSWCAPPGRRP